MAPSWDTEEEALRASVRSLTPRAIHNLRWSLADLHDSAESPIEWSFAVALIAEAATYGISVWGGYFDTEKGAVVLNDRMPILGVDTSMQLTIYPQIPIGPYRVDFLLRYETCDHLDALIVECDGHDYHERTKLQAKKDRARDRWLAAQGHSFFRFTGSEIYKDANSCAEETLRKLEPLLRKGVA